MSLSYDAYIRRLYSQGLVLESTSSVPDTSAGQSALLLSDGSIPDTAVNTLYIMNKSAVPREICTQTGYEQFWSSEGRNPDASIECSEIKLDTGGLVVLHLSNGVPSAKKKILISIASPNSRLRLVVDCFANGTGIEFDAAGQSCSLVWSSIGWVLDNGGGVVY